MMTEDQAAQGWCPFTRVGEQASGAAENRPDGSYNCIASRCMAWRVSGQKYLDQGKLYDRDNTGRGRWIDLGYCGLAGAPKS